MERNTNFSAVVALWKADKRRYVKKSTYATYCTLIRSHLLPELGEKDNISEEDVQEFVNRKLADGLSRKTVRDILVILKMILRYGAKHELLPERQIDVVFPPERENHEVQVLTLANQRKLMNYVKENPGYLNLGILICLAAGLRIGEVCALQWNDVDVASGIIRVNKTIQWIYLADENERFTGIIIDKPKTRNSQREIPMTRELLSLLRPLKKDAHGDYYVLTNAPTPTEPRTYRNYFNKVLLRLGLPKMRFHGLRHSFATRCIESKCDYKTVSVLLGHSNISTTLNLYVHPNLEQKRKCINSMGKLLN